MATDPIEQSALARLNRIAGELHAINTVIIADLTTLRGQPELVKRLAGRCDELALKLEALRTESHSSINGNSDGGENRPHLSADEPGLQA